MYKRPSSKETDEDLLQLQADFEQRKDTIQLAAKVAVRNAAKPTASADHFERNILSKNDEQVASTVLGKVIERTDIKCLKELKLQKNGFPVVSRRKNINDNTSNCKAVKSLSVDELANNNTNVHLENVDKLSKMSINEILEEKRFLEQKLDPKLVEFLKNRSKTNKVSCENVSESIKVEDFDLNEFIDSGLYDVLQNENSKNWLNFNIVEPEKLEWCKSVRQNFKNRAKNDEFEARFDLNGKLMPYELEMTEENRILYHHGEEGNRPGYSIKELLHLSRSSVIQQRITALTVLEKCLENYSIGLYDGIFELPIEQIFFVLRFSLDENNSLPILEKSIKAMRNIIFSEIDEKCLDNLYFIGMELDLPIYEYSFKTSKEYEEIDDQQLAEIDLIKCFARTNIFTRITYIFNMLKPSNINIVKACFQLLLRLVQDSQFTLQRFYENDYLIDTIITYFVPKITNFDSCVPSYNYPMIEALKLIRILILKDSKMIIPILNRYKVIDAISQYIVLDVEKNLYAILVQIEALGIWMALLKHQLCIEKFSEIHQVLLRIFNFHINKTNLDDIKSLVIQKHYIAVINVLTLAYKNEQFNSNKITYVNLLKIAFAKFLNQLLNADEFKSVHFQLIIALINSVNQLCLDGFSSFIESLIKSNNFQYILKELLHCSNFLFDNDLKPHTTGAAFSNLEIVCLDADNNLIPAIRDFGCCQMFFKALASYLLIFKESGLMIQLADNVYFQKYLKKLLKKSKLSLVSNWCTEVLEKNIVFYILLMLSSTNFDTLHQTYLLTVKFLSYFQVKNCYIIEVLLRKVIFAEPELKAVHQFVLTSMKDIKFLNRCYLNNKEFLDSNWIYKGLQYFLDENYEPISDNSKLSNIEIDKFIEVLKWIGQMDQTLSKTDLLPSATNRFCRFSEVFLSSPKVFLNVQVNSEVTNSLRFILNQNPRLNFDEQISGFGKFENLYKKLLEQYQSCSFCDKTFANVILMPLEQNQNLKWRQIFWSEYEVISKLIFLNENEIFVKLERFLEPKEIDNSLKKIYRRLLEDNVFRNRARPLLTQIIAHHLKRTPPAF